MASQAIQRLPPSTSRSRRTDRNLEALTRKLSRNMLQKIKHYRSLTTLRISLESRDSSMIDNSEIKIATDKYCRTK